MFLSVPAKTWEQCPTWETPAGKATVASPKPNVPLLPASLLLLLPCINPTSPRRSLIHSIPPTRSTHNTSSSSGSKARRGDLAIPFLAARVSATSMAAVVAGGAVVLQLRVPSSSSSSSSSASVQRRRRAPSVRCGATRARPAGGVEEDHYRTLRLAPGATRREVKKAFRRLALQYHPDVLSRRGDDSEAVDFQRINLAYQRVMSNVRKAEAKLEYWRARYGLADEDLDRYRRYLNDEDEDDWFADL